MQTHVKTLIARQDFVFSAQMTAEAEAVLFGSRASLEMLLLPPVPPTAATLPVVANAIGEQLKFFAKAISRHPSLSNSNEGENDQGCGEIVAAQDAPSHHFFTRQKKIVFVKTVHTTPAAVEAHEVDLVKPAFTRSDDDSATLPVGSNNHCTVLRRFMLLVPTC